MIETDRIGANHELTGREKGKKKEKGEMKMDRERGEGTIIKKGKGIVGQ